MTQTSIDPRYRELYEELKQASFEAFRASAAKHAGEKFYSVALYTSGTYGYIVDSVSTFEGLEQVAAHYLGKSSYLVEWGTLDTAMKALKWNTPDSPYHVEFEGHFERAQEALASIWAGVDYDDSDQYWSVYREIRNIFYAVLAEIRDSGIFDKDEVIFALLVGDLSDEEHLINAEPLNAKPLVDRLRSELTIDDEQLAQVRQSLAANAG